MMKLSTALAEAQTLLETHPRGILPLPSRRRVWSALIVPGDDPVSCRRLWALKAACVEHSLSFWYRAFPDDNRVSEYLELARKVEAGLVDGNEADLAATRFWQSLLQTVEFDDVTEPAVFVADAAVKIVRAAASHDPRFDIVDEIADDDELGPDSYESSYLCAAAFGGMNWQHPPAIDVEARRGFWRWYLTQAVPQVAAIDVVG
ncbi:Imm5 family immunity protein [Buchananella hordeovulneris]|uniref:Imm5 family immunity protein n=1 Tax=Buchananella hordeovulneris TaxID=52770 RepID=UPI000F5E4514|nr:Imm5 family immunity protein [Buchananella hordeovulneris]RRD43177.1 immunity protein [Buchananella hordeovulneris]